MQLAQTGQHAVHICCRIQMIAILARIEDTYARLAAPPEFPDRDKTKAAENLHAVLSTIIVLFAAALLIGTPFLFSNRPLAAAVCLTVLGACALSWILMRRGSVRRAGLLVIAILWLAVAFVTLFARSENIIPFVSVMAIAYLLSGPRLALAVAASAIVIIAAVVLSEQLGISMPMALFHPAPQTGLFLTVLFLGLATMPFVLLNRQLRHAIQRLERFSAVQQDMRIVTWFWDSGHKRHDRAQYDRDFSPFLGLAPGAFSGRFEDYLRCLHPDDAPVAKSRLADCIKSMRPSYRGEERVIWPDGSVHWLGIEGHLAFGAGGSVTRMTGIVIDVTDRKLGELALASAEQRFAQAFHSSPIALVIVRLSDGSMLEVNSMFERLSGYSGSEVIGRTGGDLNLWTDPGDRDRWYGEVAAKGVVYDLPMQFRAKNGTVLSTRLSSSVFDLGSERVIISFVHDVTAQERAERQIRESEEKYAAVFDTCPEAIAISRASDGTMLEVNQTWTQQTGYSRAQALGRSALELGLWRHTAERDAVLRRLEAAGQVSNFSSQFVRANGSAMEVLVSATRLLLNDEACIAWVWRDISALRLLEQARTDSDRRYRTLFDFALDAIAVVSPQGVLVDINQFGLRTTGYAADELIGKSIEILFDPERLARNPLRMADVYKLETVRINRTIRRKDGAQIPAEILASPLPDGNILAIVRDVSERNRSQVLLRQIARGVSTVVGETFFRSLVSNLAKELSSEYCFIGEIIPRDTGRVRTLAFCADGEVAPNFEYRLEGSPCANVIARRGSIAFPVGVASQFPADSGLQRMAVEGYIGTSLFDSEDAVIGILVVMSRKAISEVALWTSVLEIFAARAAAEMERTRAEARILELNASLEQRVLERTAALESANRELESFSYSVSHDLRAPLRGIDGFAGILLQECKATLDENAYSLLTRISKNASRMNQLIEDLLQFARAGRGTLKSTRIDMRELVDRVIEELQAGDTTRTEITIGELPPAMGDASVVRQVWQNLVSNALKFSRKAAQPKIRIEGTRRQEMVEYVVSDNGAGFDAKYANRLFGVFQRLHPSSEFEGTGIGLAIAQRIVQRHGGSIAADGAVGSGATFRFTLPA